VLLVVGSSDRMLYRVTGSENVVIGCALHLVESAVTADRRIRRRRRRIRSLLPSFSAL
jgi:hypothetical protein